MLFLLILFHCFIELSKHIKCKEDASIKASQKIKSQHDNSTADECSVLKVKMKPRLDLMSLGSKHAEVKVNTMRNRRKPTLEIQSTIPTKIKLKSK